MERAEGQAAASALKRIARSETVKRHVLGDPALYSVLLRAARTFIGGEYLADCLLTACNLNSQGSAVTIDYMGENVREPSDAEEATAEFLRIVRAINNTGLNASVSLDLSHIGLALDPGLALENADRIARATAAAGLEMMISAEGSERTDRVLETHGQLARKHDHVGVTLQANLYRTVDDLESVLERSGKIRVVKGAFQEAGSIAMPRGRNLDRTFLRTISRVISADRPCSIATHDPQVIKQARKMMAGLREDQEVEFEMLFGAARTRLARLRRDGFRTRIFLPYGREWYLYLCHRLAEYPPNIYTAIAKAVELSAGLDVEPDSGST